MHYVCCTGLNVISKVLCFWLSTIFARENCTRFCIWFCIFLFFLSCNICFYFCCYSGPELVYSSATIFYDFKNKSTAIWQKNKKKTNKKMEWKTKEKLNNPRTVQNERRDRLHGIVKPHGISYILSLWIVGAHAPKTTKE